MTPLPRLNLAYNRSIPAALLDELELVARRLGLSLAGVEDLGQSEARCRLFLAALSGVPAAMRMAIVPAGVAGRAALVPVAGSVGDSRSWARARRVVRLPPDPPKPADEPRPWGRARRVRSACF